ncbi:MAG: helix-turn-helix domain-containing protein [Azospirillaceae bacterium]
MEGPKPIRSLERGLRVLSALTRHGAQSLADLCRTTGIPKSTLRRVLVTLEDNRFVRQSLADQLFRANVSAPVSQALAQSGFVGRLAAIAAPYLEELTKRVVWPSDLLVRNGIHMEIVETSRTRTPLIVNRNEIGDRVDIVLSAVGRAYVAACGAAERRDILRDLDQAGWRQVGRPSITREAFLEEIERTRRRGYGIRHSGFTGATSKWPETNDRLQAIAVAVGDADGVLGCVNLLWPKEVMTAEEFAGRYLDLLRAITDRIHHAFQDRGTPATAPVSRSLADAG